MTAALDFALADDQPFLDDRDMLLGRAGAGRAGLLAAAEHRALGLRAGPALVAPGRGALVHVDAARVLQRADGAVDIVVVDVRGEQVAAPPHAFLVEVAVFMRDGVIVRPHSAAFPARLHGRLIVDADAAGVAIGELEAGLAVLGVFTRVEQGGDGT